MNCRETNALLSQYIDGDLTPRQASSIQSHLLGCRSCAEDLEHLLKTISTLESIPHDEQQVDLYQRFRNRLERQPKRARTWTPTMPTRKWAVGGAIVVLLFIGNLIGSFIGGREVLYVSRPRAEQSPLFSSIAIAADKAQDRSDVDAALYKDARLRRKIDVTSKGESLDRIIGALSRRAGVKMTVASDLACQRMYLRLDDVPIATVMAEIRRLLDLDWRILDEAGGRSYQLAQSKRVRNMATSVAEAQAFAEAVMILEKLKTAVETHDPEPISQYGIKGCNGIYRELQALQADAKHEIDRNALYFFLIDDEVISAIKAAGKYVKPYVELSPKHQEFFRRCFECRMSGQRVQPEELSLRIALSRDDDGSMLINIGTREGELDTSVTGFGVNDPIYGKRDTNKLTEANLADLYADAVAANPAYKDSRLRVKMGNGVYGESSRWRNKPTYTLAEMLDLITDRTNLQVVSDFFSADQGLNRMIPVELGLGQLLAILDRDYNIAWYLSRDNTLYLVHRQWPILRETEPDEGLVERMSDTIRAKGRLDLPELAKLAMLSDVKLSGTIAAIRSDDDRISDLTGDVHNIIVNLGNELRLYGSLTPDQRRMAESPEGLPADRMTRQQKLLAYCAACGTSEGAAERLAQISGFSVSRARTTAREIEKIPSNGTTFIGVTGSSPRDYVVFRITGRQPHVAAFSQRERGDL